MNHIVFYISSHGYGHALRCIPIIEELLEQDEELVITVKSDRILTLHMSRYLGHYRSRIQYMWLITDVGLILKPGTMEVDTQALLKEVKLFIHSWDKQIEREKVWISQNNVNLIVTDIVPWVLRSAADLGIRSILITNFTWVDIYKELLSENVWEAYLDCYQKASKVFVYPFSGEMEVYFSQTNEVGLVSRKFDPKNVNKIKEKYRRKIVYLSVGKSVSLEGDIVLEGLPYQILYTEGISVKGGNTEMLPVNTKNTHDYIKAADYIVSKAGWGTIAEAVCARKPMIILKRDEINEDRVTAAKLRELGIATQIHISNLNAEELGQYLEGLDSLRSNYDNLTPRYTNCADKIAEQILTCLY